MKIRWILTLGLLATLAVARERGVRARNFDSGENRTVNHAIQKGVQPTTGEISLQVMRLGGVAFSQRGWTVAFSKPEFAHFSVGGKSDMTFVDWKVTASDGTTVVHYDAEELYGKCFDGGDIFSVTTNQIVAQ